MLLSFLLNNLNFTKFWRSSSFCNSFIFWTKICPYLYRSSFCLNLSIYLARICSIITYFPFRASSFLTTYIYSNSFIFLSRSISIILSFFIYWTLKDYQSLFFSSNCFSLIVAALAYATILFISLTSSSCSWVDSTALCWMWVLYYNFSLSN